MALTDKQEGFAVTYTINGGDASDAYRENYDVGEDTKPTTIWVDAHKLLHTPNVSQRVHELRTLKINKKVLTIDERKQLLTEWALDGSDKALDLLNKMEGVYTDKLELTGSVITRKIITNPTKDKK